MGDSWCWVQEVAPFKEAFQEHLAAIQRSLVTLAASFDLNGSPDDVALASPTHPTAEVPPQPSSSLPALGSASIDYHLQCVPKP